MKSESLFGNGLLRRSSLAECHEGMKDGCLFSNVLLRRSSVAEKHAMRV